MGRDTRKARTLVCQLILGGLALLLADRALAEGAGRPVGVSPGNAERVEAAPACPTFSWAAERGEAVELVVFRVEEDGEGAPPALRQVLPGGATSWGPSLDRCFHPGAVYAWSVRTLEKRTGSDGEWSKPLLFQVAHQAEEGRLVRAVAAAREQLVRDGSAGPGMIDESSLAGHETWEALTPAVESGPVSADESSPPPVAAAGPADEVVIGNGTILINGRPATVRSGKTVFVTSTKYNGNLGGLAGADAKCNARAAAAGLTGTYKAWLSVPGCGPADPCRDFTQSSGPYLRVDGVRIADSFASLYFNEVEIVVDELGVEIPVCGPGSRVWTYTTGLGRPEPSSLDIHCNEWASGSAADTGVGNDLCVSMSLNWSASCDTEWRLFCFEQ